MIREEIEYFQIEVGGGEGFPPNLFYYTEKGELFISPAGRLCGPAAAAAIESRSISERFAEALMPRMQKKYGASIDLRVAKSSSRGHHNQIKRNQLRIKEHTEKITRWLHSNSK